MTLLKQIRSSINPARAFLNSMHPFSQADAQELYHFFWQESKGGTQPSPDLLEALAKSMQLGAKAPRTTAGDIVLRNFANIDAKTNIRTVKTVLLRQKKEFIVLFLNGRCIGHVWSREVNDAIQHGFADAPILSISCGLPLFLPSTASTYEIANAFANSPCNIAIILQEDQILGYVDPQALLHRTVTKKTLPDSWIEYLGAQYDIAQQIGTTAEELGYHIYIVGGFVRDYFQQRSTLDIDCNVEGEAITLGHTLHKRFGGSLTNNALFGASHWTTPSGVNIDLTSTRTEIYSHPGALPATSPSDLLADFHRRDFTINMMAICINPSRWGEFLDPYGGEQDLQHKKIRVVHGLSFLDDPTRIFRAARYAGRYGFTLHSETKYLLQSALPLIELGQDISLERIGNELQRIFREEQPYECWQHLVSWQVIAEWFPDLCTDITPHMKQLTAEIQQAHITDKALIERAYWTLFSWNLPPEKRQHYVQLVATQSKGQRHWNSAPIIIDTLQRELQGLGDLGLAGTILQHTQLDQWLITVIIDPSVKEIIQWWRQTGQHIKCTINGKKLLDLGCPQGPSIGKALLLAKQAAWRGGNEQAQLNATRDIWACKDT